MKIREKIQEFLGIGWLLEESANHFKRIDRLESSLNKVNASVDSVRDESLRLRRLIVENFAQNKPASIEVIDAIFKETRDRLDVVMVTLDSFRDAMVRRY